MATIGSWCVELEGVFPTSEAEEATAIKATVAAKKDFMWTLFNMKFGQKGVEKLSCDVNIFVILNRRVN